ncbi:MAG TPA: hypothetical protein VGB04_00475 [Allosphingosinicella sp.]|jgi:hypothetical protein
MTDEDEGLALRHAARDGDEYLYDFFKYMTSVSLLTLGGVLTVAQMAGPGELKQHTLLMIMAPVAASTLMAFSGASEMVRAKTARQEVSKTTHRLAKIAPAPFLIGVGAFIALFVDVMF